MKQKTEVRSLPAETITKAGQKTDRFRRGSAIILAIVLTTLLAIMGVLFLLSSRVDSVATSAVGDNQDLKLAVDTVVAQISEVITRDVPGVDPNGTYYDYPDDNNPWLASLEPNYSGVWPHITDLYYPYQLGSLAYNLPPGIIYDHSDQAVTGVPADADGDGVSDSMWVQVRGKASSKGKPIYAAVRIIDNGGMLNVNTGYRFDVNDTSRTDGSSQMQINLLALAKRPYANPAESVIRANADNLVNYRCGSGPNSINSYTSNVVWQYGPPVGAYMPFDISDELEMRYRFVIDQENTNTRWESWDKPFDSPAKTHPFDTVSGYSLNGWFNYVHDSSFFDANYAYRHIATTYNCDRIINPAGQKMFNINSASVSDINTVLNALSAALDPNIFDANQIAVNLIDYIDTDSNVTCFVDPGTSKRYYGFETPCIYISEIAESIVHYSSPNDFNASSYAIELYKPYWTDPSPAIDPCNSWQLVITDKLFNKSYIPIVWSGSQRFHVIEWIDINNNAPIDVNFSDVNGPNDINEPNNPGAQRAYVAFSGGELMELQRYVPEANTFITVDFVTVPEPNASAGWLQPIDVNALSEKVYSYQRDMGGGVNPHKLIRGKPVALGVGLWSGDFGLFPTPSIGTLNPWVSPEPYTFPYLIQAHPANKPFTNVGEIGQLFRTIAYTITRADTEFTTRLNLADPCVQNLFKYLTVIDPTRDGIDNDGDGAIEPDNDELKIKGRININTAPWFVIAQLPWVSWIPTEPLNYRLAQAIVAYRDKTLTPSGIDFSARLGSPGFQSIGQLNNVIFIADPCSSIAYYAQTGNIFPALTPPDGAGDYFEVRDAIFARISNLVTVRSDVFTAYILVRIGADGPQKRVIAILDRSGVTPTSGKVKIVAIQSVPDPR